jgi:hypothetical protein
VRIQKDIANPTKEQEEVIAKDEQRGANLGFEAIVKSKILSHFIKGKKSFNSHGNHSYHSRIIREFGRFS